MTRVHGAPAWRVPVLLAVAVAAFALTLSLGNWQTRRAAQKLAIEAQWDAAEQAAPQRLSGRDMPAADALPMRVQLTGRFDHARSVWLDNRQLDARPGFWVVTPLTLADGAVVLVNRGWVARDPADRARRPPIGQPAGELTIEGLAVTHAPRLLELGDGGNAGALPAIWQNLDYAQYEAASGLSVARLVVQQTSAMADGLQRRWVRPASGVDKHRGYAVQWYGLSALIAILTLFFGVRAWRARRVSES
ncbi:MAG: SURF1 family protein [Burkholderiaceae bacterium]|nr:SURF1 family protein [Burkholderiaceae bacterium]